ncbi:MAG: hypothetical protein ACREDD_12580 [Methylocella sp.]
MDVATLGRRARRDDWRRENPSWTIGFEKSSYCGGKKKLGWHFLPAGPERKT